MDKDFRIKFMYHEDYDRQNPAETDVYVPVEVGCVM